MMLPTGPLEQAMTVRSRPLMQTLPDPNMRRAWQRARRRGQITDVLADRIAIVAIGMPLELIYTADQLQEPVR